MTYARDAVASTTVRRDDKTGRKKAREMARAKREAEKREKEQDLARLRKLKVEDMENKVKQIRQIGGLSGRDFKIEECKDVLEADWSDEQWDAEMQSEEERPPPLPEWSRIRPTSATQNTTWKNASMTAKKTAKPIHDDSM